MLSQNEAIHQWVNEDILDAIQQRVSQYHARQWRVTRVLDRTDAASHPAAVLSSDALAVFVKLGRGAQAADRFHQELAGLTLLRTHGSLQTPTGIAVLETDEGAVLIMAAVQEVERDESHYQQMGRALAQLHRATNDRFGLDSHCYWGDLFQDNTPADDWPTFFWERRLAPRLRAAVDSGNLPARFVREIEQIGARLAAMCGPAVVPALLHGDAHKNNCLATPHGPVFIDPSVYYGHPEMDLAYVDFFEPVPDEVYAGYSEITPLDPGFAERRDLWRLPALLAMVEFIGAEYLDKLDAAVRHYR